MGEPEVPPKTDVELQVMLRACLLNKAVCELGCELNNLPAWVMILLAGVLDLMGAGMPR